MAALAPCSPSLWRCWRRACTPFLTSAGAFLCCGDVVAMVRRRGLPWDEDKLATADGLPVAPRLATAPAHSKYTSLGAHLAVGRGGGCIRLYMAPLWACMQRGSNDVRATYERLTRSGQSQS
jgi:hypothetical protein